MRIEIPQRTDVLLRIRPQINGEPIPLDGSTFRFGVGTVYGSKVFEKEGVVTDDHVAVEITWEDSNLPVGVYRVELLQIDVEGARIQAGRGLLVITPSMFEGDGENGGTVPDYGG